MCLLDRHSYVCLRVSVSTYGWCVGCRGVPRLGLRPSVHFETTPCSASSLSLSSSWCTYTWLFFQTGFSSSSSSPSSSSSSFLYVPPHFGGYSRGGDSEEFSFSLSFSLILFCCVETPDRTKPLFTYAPLGGFVSSSPFSSSSSSFSFPLWRFPRKWSHVCFFGDP